ncbi:MAG: GDP-L-fucose synthase [Bacteroidota bacterium]|nr:GDP-L-fucose synthase [Bacteroidota bacterium]
MNKDAKIFVAGHRGLVGSAIVKALQQQGYQNLVLKTSSELDLRDQKATAAFFAEEKPEYVFLAAAKVGGIMANNTYRAEFIFENIQIQNNIIHNSYLTGVKKLLFLGSSCIYPKNAPQPMKEEHLLTSPLEYTNEPYAIAKIAGIKMSESYNLQYGTNYISVMPTNLYGHNDNFDLEKSHVLPALIRKMHLGKALQNNDWTAIRKDFDRNPVEKVDGKASDEQILEKLAKYGIRKNGSSVDVTLWGTGKPLREFLFSDDLAAACVFLMEKVDFKELVAISTDTAKEVRNTHINIGSGVDLPIGELAELVKKIVGFEGNIVWDSTKPDGTFKKLLDVSKLKKLGWEYKVKLPEGIAKVYENYQQ